MVKFLKPGKVVIVTRGKFAGRKAVILKNFDEGNNATKRAYGHAILAGVDKAPLKVTKAMTRRKISRRTRVKPFVKVMNYNHLMPTRYNLEFEAKNLFAAGKDEALDAAKKTKLKNQIKEQFQQKFNAGTNKWFFTKLRF
eukprot:TRINITY_DN8663_c0_g1_i1.p2 TRINITY_DN8663_c0_g1~~TRINITY_DN8663_c0_g1_i1.p2  ORF type:complete len:140 (+),score=47.34 TRINITY_DN8663_c0_g1_i1:59-478(+)